MWASCGPFENISKNKNGGWTFSFLQVQVTLKLHPSLNLKRECCLMAVEGELLPVLFFCVLERRLCL